MNQPLIDIFKRLSFETENGIKEYIFSTEYLGRNKTYFSYLKSSGKKVSAGCLLHLWTKLNGKRNAYQEAYNRAVQNGQATSWQTLGMKERIELYDDLSSQAYEAITEYHK